MGVWELNDEFHFNFFFFTFFLHLKNWIYDLFRQPLLPPPPNFSLWPEIFDLSNNCPSLPLTQWQCSWFACPCLSIWLRFRRIRRRISSLITECLDLICARQTPRFGHSTHLTFSNLIFWHDFHTTPLLHSGNYRITIICLGLRHGFFEWTCGGVCSRPFAPHFAVFVEKGLNVGKNFRWRTGRASFCCAPSVE